MSRARPRIELFGAPRVLRGAVEIRLPVKKSLALLAYLAVEGRATRAKLAALFWGDSGGEAARRNLRRELHRLREADLGDLLVADAESVTLAESVQSDVGDFCAALAARNRVAAVAAWHGPLMDGFDLAESEEFDRWLASRRDDFARRYATAALTLATEREASGDARGALALHSQLIQNDPLQESHYAAAMRLHYLLGERGRALELFERCRSTLAKELGLQPLPETAALAERIRAADQVAPLATPAATSGVAQIVPPLVGRATELARLAAGPIVTLITGEPGVGKSRLADEATRGPSGRLRLNGSALGRQAPLFPVVEALGAVLGDSAMRVRLDSLDGAQRSELARLLPGLALRESRAPDDAPPAAQRARLLDAVATALITLAPEAIWIDDLHWLDGLTLELLHHLAHRLGRERRTLPRIVVTARSQELADHAVAAATVLKLERAQLLQRIELAPLDAAATTELVRRLSGARGGIFAERLQRTTRGNPFFLLETIRFLFDSGELTIDPRGVWSTRYDDATSDYAELPVPPTIQQAVLERVERLGPAARRVLETAALAGDDFTLDEVQPATALSEWEALEGLERASGASLVVGAETHYRFGHDLVRMALDRSLGAERRRLIHRRLAEALIPRGGRPGQVAWHLDEAGEHAAAVSWHLSAARAAETVFAQDEALGHYRSALSACEDARQRVEIHRARFALLKQAFTLKDVLAEAEALRRIAAGSNDTALEVEAHVWRADGFNMADNFPAALAESEAALRLAGPDALPTLVRYELHMCLAQSLHGSGRFGEAERCLRHEIAHATELDPRQVAEVQHRLAYIAISTGMPEAAVGPASAALSVAIETGDVELRGKCANVLAYVQQTQGDSAAALQTMLAAQEAAERAHLVAVQRSLLTNLVKLHVALNQPAEAHARMQQALQLFDTTDDPATHSKLQSRLTEVLLLKGDIGGALASTCESIRSLESIGGPAGTFWPWYQRARLLWQCGASDEAVAVYRALPASPAWSEVAQPAIDFFGQAFRLPGSASEVANELAQVPSHGDHSHYDERDHCYWRAMARSLAGDAVGNSLLANLQATPFTLHAAVIEALRLRVAIANGEVTADMVAAATALLARSPPLEGLELRGALGAALEAAGDPAAAERLRREARSAMQSMADSIEDRALRERFIQRHAALLAAPTQGRASARPGSKRAR